MVMSHMYVASRWSLICALLALNIMICCRVHDNYEFRRGLRYDCGGAGNTGKLRQDFEIDCAHMMLNANFSANINSITDFRGLGGQKLVALEPNYHVS